LNENVVIENARKSKTCCFEISDIQTEFLLHCDEDIGAGLQ